MRKLKFLLAVLDFHCHQKSADNASSGSSYLVHIPNADKNISAFPLPLNRKVLDPFSSRSYILFSQN